MMRILLPGLLAAVVCTTASSAWGFPDFVTSSTPGGWSYPALPRSTPDATTISAPLQSSALPGNSPSTYWNSNVVNLSFDPSAACYQATYMDDVLQAYGGPSSFPGGGQAFYLNQAAPAPVKGGRHTLLSRADVFGTVAESNESNNDWTRQYIWSGLALTANIPVTRTYDPYIFTTGWGPNGNNEGFSGSASSPSYWNVFAVTPQDASSDFDIALCTETPLNVPQQGFGNAVAVSYLRSAATDFVILDRNVVFPGTYYASVYNWWGTANKVVEFDADRGLLFNPGESAVYVLNPGEIVNMHEVYLTAGQRTRIQVSRRAGDSDVYLGLFNPSSGFASADAAVAAATTQGLGLGNDVYVDVTASTSDFFGIVVAKPDSPSLGKSIQYSVVVSQLPNITRYAAQGWYGPLVPRSAPDASTFNVPLSPILDGNLQNTWINFSSVNQGPGTAPNFWTELFADDWSIAQGFFVGDCPESAFLTWLNVSQDGPGFWFTGGLHHLRTHADMYDTVLEFPETDNDFTDWFVWSPMVLPNEVPMALAAPPIHAPYGGGPYESCDGYRLPGLPSGSYWTAVSMLPLSDNEYDVRIHPGSTGSKDGFGSTLAWSSDPVGGNADFCIVNFNAASPLVYDFSVTNWDNSYDAYAIQRSDAVYRGIVPAGPWRLGPFTLDAYDSINIQEFYFEAGVPYYISVNNVAGNVDLGLYLFDGTVPYHTKQTSTAFSSNAGPGGDEHIGPITFPSPRFGAVVVSKSNYFDAYPTATYELVLTTGQSVVDAPVVANAPTAFALSAPRPNPFANQTTIELAVPPGHGKASVAVYDLQGRRVADLASESTPGRHTLAWDGRDSNGREAAAGVYFVRLEAAGVNETKKITLLR